MKLADAKTAGDLAARIEVRQAKLAAIAEAQADGWIIKDIRAVRGDGREMSVIVDVLDPQTSQFVLASAVQIYEQQIAGLQAQLDAL